jgi:molybdopterin-binding protein
LKLDHIISDRSQYKPYIAQLSGNENVFIDIEIPADTVLEVTSKVTVLSEDGLAAILGKVADAIDAMHSKYRIKTFGN